MSLLVARRQRPAPPPVSGTTWLRIVDDKTALTTGDLVMSAIMSGLGHTIADTVNWADLPLSTDGDVHVVCPSVLVPNNDTGGYIGETKPTVSICQGSWTRNAGMYLSNTLGPLGDGNNTRYTAAEPFAWTGQTVGQLVAYQTTSTAKWWAAAASVLVGDQVVTVSNASFSSDRACSVGAPAGGTLANGDSNRQKLWWVGFADTLEADGLNAAGQQLIEDAITWALSP